MADTDVAGWHYIGDVDPAEGGVWLNPEREYGFAEGLRVDSVEDFQIYVSPIVINFSIWDEVKKALDCYDDGYCQWLESTMSEKCMDWKEMREELPLGDILMIAEACMHYGYYDESVRSDLVIYLSDWNLYKEKIVDARGVRNGTLPTVIQDGSIIDYCKEHYL